MKDNELKEAIKVKESRLFRNLTIMIETDPQYSGFKTLEDFKRFIRDEKKKLDKWISDNEDE